ncbi:MAG: hypothetical protein ISS26_05155 [Candidatus Omnitrophica bacterium]|nr:hypothetical protein [Candidatus Omnitrophota bacterium]
MNNPDKLSDPVKKEYFSDLYWKFGYLSKGLYADELQKWFDIFPRKQFCVIKSEDLYSDPDHIYKWDR